jgi:plastocyanin
MKNPLLVLGLVLVLNSVAHNAVDGELNGRILITKNMTRKRVTLPAYQLRGISAPEPEISRRVDEYSELVVFLEGSLPSDEQPIRAELKQQHHRFEPQMLIIPVGSSVSFPNADPIFHNVFSLSSVKKFDLGYYPAGQTRVIKFDAAGVVQVYCHLHPNMYAAIIVVPNRWYVRPAEDGTFSLNGIPAGAYHVVTWHMNAGFFRRQVQVPANGVVNLDMNIPVRSEEQNR